ncbi:hypothetical protein INR49_021552 [Caranx melampygus]|nr:hypothetical protein INR49_021552 [Caranx melampygus]
MAVKERVSDCTSQSDRSEGLPELSRLVCEAGLPDCLTTDSRGGGHLVTSGEVLQLADQWDPHGSPQATLSGPVLPPGTPFPNQPQHRTSVPDSTEGFDLNKPDPYDLYEKSRAIYESRRPEYEEVEVHLLREKTGFGFRILGETRPCRL